MKLSRLWVFLIGLLFLLILFAINRVRVYNNSNFTHGVLVCPTESLDERHDVELTLYYYVGMKEFTVTKYDVPVEVNQIVMVRYPKDQPEKGTIYTVLDFWFVSALYLLLPLMLWFAFVFSWLDENGKVEVKFIRRMRQKSNGTPEKE